MQYTSIFLAFLAAGFASASPVAAPDVSGAEDSFANLVARETQYHCGKNNDVRVYSQADIDKAMKTAKKHINTPASAPKDPVNGFPHNYNQHDIPINNALPDTCKSSKNKALKVIFEWAIFGDERDRLLIGNDGKKNFLCLVISHRGQDDNLFVPCDKTG
ncbi:hypothetical protein GGS26DRAFT_592420 [Hypomontagnella submonticulosa]|nr:hypothetical protein GGS26DRAFT_592420 [Hypomontagnella submonticulosa]